MMAQQQQTPQSGSAPPPAATCLGRCLCITFSLIVIIGVGAFLTWPPKPPSFKVESASVIFHKSNNNNSSSSDDDDATTRAEWNIRLSAKAGTRRNEFEYNDLDVLFRLATSSNWSKTVLVQSSDDQDPKSMASLNATVETLLPPRSFDHIGSPLEFQVMFVVQFLDDDPIMKAVCNHMIVGLISPDANEGVMEGGPRLCPYGY